eukprot:gene265-7873_t
MRPPAPPGGAAADGGFAPPPELLRLSDQQLQLLQRSPAAYECFFHSLAFVRDVTQANLDLRAEVERQA